MEEMFSSLICFYLFFLYISFGTFFGQGIAPASQRVVKQCNQNKESDIYGNTALPLAPDLIKAFKLHIGEPRTREWWTPRIKKTSQQKNLKKNNKNILNRCYFSLSFIASTRSSGLHPVSSHSCCMYVRAGHPAFAFAWPYARVHRSTSLMSSSLLLQQCSACLVRLAWIVFVMGGRWPYSWYLVGYYCQDLFNIARNILA